MNNLENPMLDRENWGLSRYTLFFLFMLKSIDSEYAL